MASIPSFRFASRDGRLDAYGARVTLRTPARGGLLDQAQQLLRGLGAGDRLVGALPFSPDAPAALFVPDRVEIDQAPAAGTPGPIPAPRTIEGEPDGGDYQQMVAHALEQLRATTAGDRALRKVVLARTLLVTFDEPVDISRLFDALGEDPAATVYQTAFTRADGEPAYFVGASPELLVDRQGDVVRSMPMAGSVPRAASPAEDRARASGLLHSGKDLREHRLVIESVLDVLAPYCRELDAPSTPELASTATMWHLATPVTGRLRGETSSLELALALHPTPAVCGTPCEAARDAICSLEPFDRGLFAGAVGWCDGRGDGRWMVAIRCADICGRQARLYAGAGIVAGSNPAAEAAETGAKFGALLRALGVPAGATMTGRRAPATHAVTLRR